MPDRRRIGSSIFHAELVGSFTGKCARGTRRIRLRVCLPCCHDRKGSGCCRTWCISEAKERRELRREGMIEPHTGRVDPARQRIRLYKLRKAWRGCRSIVISVLQRKCIQHGLQCSRSRLTHIAVWDVLNGRRLRLSQPQPLIGHEKEACVFAIVDPRNRNRPAQRPAKIVLAECRNGITIVVVEPIVGIEKLLRR